MEADARAVRGGFAPDPSSGQALRFADALPRVRSLGLAEHDSVSAMWVSLPFDTGATDKRSGLH